MSRVQLKLARPPAPKPRIPYSLIKRAIQLYRGRGVPKAVYRRHAREWLKQRERMGDQHILNAKFLPRWGVPGAGDGVGVSQVFAPRRLSTGGK